MVKSQYYLSSQELDLKLHVIQLWLIGHKKRFAKSLSFIHLRHGASFSVAPDGDKEGCPEHYVQPSYSPERASLSRYQWQIRETEHLGP